MSSVNIVIATPENQMDIQYTVYFNGQQDQLIYFKTLYFYNWLENDTRKFKRQCRQIKVSIQKSILLT